MTDPHPNDESLSAALDGDDAPATTHVAGCATCRARSVELDAARRAVGADASVTGTPPGLADRAVAAAAAAYLAERATAAAPAAPVGGGVVLPLHRPTAGTPDSFTSRRPSASGRGKRVPGWALGAAAALAAMLLAVPLLNRDAGDDQPQTATAARDNSASLAAGAAEAAQVADGGDLGEQSDQLALGGVLSGAVGGTATDLPAPAAADRATTAASDGAKSTASQPPAAPGVQAPAPVLAAPDSAPQAAAPSPLAAETTPTTADPAAIAKCETTVGTDFGRGLGPLLYRATLRWQGTPSVLLAYRLADTTGNGPDHRAFVMALDGCRLLVVQGF